MQNPFTLPTFRARQMERGSVLVICMVLAGLGTIGVAAWVALLDARGNQVEAHISSLQQRVADRNSQALAYRALYANHLPSASTFPSDITYTLPDNLGECTITGYTDVPLQNASSIRVSNNGGTPVRSFTTDVTVTLPNGNGTREWQYQLRSFNPILGGDLLTIHPPLSFDSSTPLVAGRLIVEGRALFWDATKDDFAGGFRASEVVLPNDILGSTSFANAAGSAILPSNYPIPKQTTGLAGASSPYEGKIDVFNASPNGHNSYEQRINDSVTSETLKGQVSEAQGAGPITRVPTGNDPQIEALIAIQSPAELVTDLVRFYPLSSTMLQRVFDKSDQPFNANQLFQVLSGQGTLATDSLIELESNQADRLNPADLRAVHEANETVYVSNGSGRVKVFLNRPVLPHLIVENVTDLEIVGQSSDAFDSQAEALPPRIILVLNDATTTLSSVRFFEKNARRMALAISSDEAAPAVARFSFEGSNSFPNWHTILELKNTTIDLEASSVSEVVIVGGIRTNQPINVSSGTLRITQQFVPNGLETLLSRNAWIEAFSL